MDRRGFLRGLLGVGAVAVAAPIVEPVTKYFFAPSQGWVLNSGIYTSSCWSRKTPTEIMDDVNAALLQVHEAGAYQPDRIWVPRNHMAFLTAELDHMDVKLTSPLNRPNSGSFAFMGGARC